MLRAKTSLVSLSIVLFLAGCTEPEQRGTAVFDNTKMHAIELTVDKQYLGQLETDLDNRVPCTISYDGEVVEAAGCRQKGNKAEPLTGEPSFSVKLDDFDSDAHLFGLHKILLNSSKQDDTLLHEQIGGEMYARAGIPSARITRATVRLNGNDLGIYVIAEAIDEDFLQAHFGEDFGGGNLYEGPCCIDFAVNPDGMELNDEGKGGRTRDDIRALADLVLNTPDDTLAAVITKRLDFEEYLTYEALEALLGHHDGYTFQSNNYYMYDNPADARFVFIPHGMDRILEDAFFDTEKEPASKLAARVRQIQTLQKKLDDERARVWMSVWDEAAITAAIDQAEKMVHSASSGAGARTQKSIADFDLALPGLRAVLELRRTVTDPAIVCGDGTKSGLEKCDDGNTVSGDGCSARCRIEAP